MFCRLIYQRSLNKSAENQRSNFFLFFSFLQQIDATDISVYMTTNPKYVLWHEIFCIEYHALHFVA